MTPERVQQRVERIVALREWLNERVSQVFYDYADVFGFHPAYGVESYVIRDTLDIVQDTSAYSCHNTESHSLPILYLYLETEPRLALMREHKAEADAEKARREEQRKRAELAHSLDRAAALRNELRAFNARRLFKATRVQGDN